MKRTRFEPEEATIFFLNVDIFSLIIQIILDGNQTKEEIEQRILTPLIYLDSFRKTCKEFNNIVKNFVSKYPKNNWSFFRVDTWPLEIKKEIPFRTSNLTLWFVNHNQPSKFQHLIEEFDIDTNKLRMKQKTNLIMIMIGKLRSTVLECNFNDFFWLFQVFCILDVTKTWDFFFYETIFLPSLTCHKCVHILDWYFANSTDRELLDENLFDNFDEVWDELIKNDQVPTMKRLLWSYGVMKNQYENLLVDSLRSSNLHSASLNGSKKESDKCNVEMTLNIHRDFVEPIIKFKSFNMMEWLVNVEFFKDTEIISIDEQVKIKKKFKKILDDLYMSPSEQEVRKNLILSLKSDE